MAIDYLPPPDAELVCPPAVFTESAQYAAATSGTPFRRTGSDLLISSTNGTSILLDGFFRTQPTSGPEAGRTLYQTKLELVDGGSNTFSFLVEDRHGNKVTDGSRLRAFFSEGGEFFAVSGIEADGKIVVELFQAAFDALSDGEFASGTLTVFIGSEEYFVPMIINNTPTPGRST